MSNGFYFIKNDMCNGVHDCSRETNIEHGPIFFIFVLSFVELLVDNFLMDRGSARSERIEFS